MSVIDRIPGREKTTRRHRAVDEVKRLRAENRVLLEMKAGWDETIVGLHQELARVRGEQAEAELTVVALQADKDDLVDERDQLEATVAALRAQLAPYLAAEANAHAVTVPPMVRDTTDGADQATAPIDVRPLWEALGIGPVTDPGQTSQGAAREAATA